MSARVQPISTLVLTSTLILAIDNAAAELVDESAGAAKRATTFLTTDVTTEGGYLWRYSADLKLREGEGIANPIPYGCNRPEHPPLARRLFDCTKLPTIGSF